MFRFFTCSLVILLSTYSSWAQEEEEDRTRVGSRIIDDTTRQVYGPTTSHYFFERDFFENNLKYHVIDTVIRNFHRFNYVQRNNNLYQDLGNIGTAIRPVYYPVRDNIGAYSGFDAYDLYWNSEAVKYFDTKSPYVNMNVILGGKGRSITDIVYSRNINPRWNFGFDFHGLFIDKQVQRSARGDRLVRSNYYDFFTSYRNKDSTYHFFFNIRRSLHQVNENGGVQVDEEDYELGDFFLVNAQPWLSISSSSDLRQSVHLYHQYRVGSALQFYHMLDSYRQRNRFSSTGGEANSDVFFDAVVVDSAVTRDLVRFKTLRNEVGIKGNLLKLFYNGYLAARRFDIDYRYFYEDDFYLRTTGTEIYLGGSMALQLDSLVTLKGKAEWMFDDRYVIDGSINTKWFFAAMKRSVATPTFLQQAYRGSHDVWLNSFSEVEATEIRGNLKYSGKVVQVFPGARFTVFRNFIFFKEGDFDSEQTVLPVQSAGYQTTVTPELNFNITLHKNINFTNLLRYTRLLENADDAVQVPEFFVNSQVSYSNIWFNGNFDFQVGVDFHWKSAYFAPGYDPVIQQFYVQQDFEVPGVPIIDVFLNAKIKRGRIFLKYNNLFKAFSPYSAIPTPYYPGIRNILDFGFDWSFYD